MIISDNTVVDIALPFRIHRLVKEFENRYYFGNEMFSEEGFVRFIIENIIPTAITFPTYNTLEIVKAAIEIHTTEQGHAITQRIFDKGLAERGIEFDPEQSWNYVHYAQEQIAEELHDSFPSLVRLIDEIQENGFSFLNVGDCFGVKRIELINFNKLQRTVQVRIKK